LSLQDITAQGGREEDTGRIKQGFLLLKKNKNNNNKTLKSQHLHG
jgi:hypothetical protein